MVCQWFALCTNNATTALPHPVLGSVPTCDHCAARVEALANEPDERAAMQRLKGRI
jgi:hypothetical protein